MPSIWFKPIDGSKEQPFAESPDNRDPVGLVAGRPFPRRSESAARGKAIQRALDPARVRSEASGPVRDRSQDQGDARFSPDGKWLAYTSNESGIAEVYVRPFPGPGGTWKVSVAGGFLPQWRGDGKEMFYLSPDSKLMAVPIVLAPAFQAGTPAALFSLQSSTSLFEASRDGKRFLINTVPEGAGSPPLNLLLNWTALAEKN